jgi:hypothetical protein
MTPDQIAEATELLARHRDLKAAHDRFRGSRLDRRNMVTVEAGQRVDRSGATLDAGARFTVCVSDLAVLVDAALAALEGELKTLDVDISERATPAQ